MRETQSTERPNGPDRGASERHPAPAVRRALRILTLLEQAAGEPVPAGTIAQGIEAAKSSTFNLCATLEEGGMITRTPEGYLLGRRTVELGAAYLARFNQVREFYAFCAAAPLLRHELLQLAMLDRTEVVYLARHEGRAPLRLSASIGSRFPAASTAVGNALLTTLSDDEIAARFFGPEHFPRRTPTSVATLSGLLTRVRTARSVGYAVDDNGVHPGVFCVAVLVPPWGSGEPALAMGASLMADQASDAFVEAITSELRQAQKYLTNPLVHGAITSGAFNTL